MKATFIEKEKNTVKFSIEFTAEEFEAGLLRAYNEAKGKISIDGFRKGKAPRSIIEKKFGEKVFFEDAIDNMLNDSYSAALDELNIDPVGRPDVTFGEEKIEKGKGWTATLSVEVAPEVNVEKYKGVEIERTVRKVTDDDVASELENSRKRNARLVSVDREAKTGDTVILDYKGFAGDNQFEGGTADNQTLVLGSGQFIPGFEDQLVGTKAGDSKDVLVTFPQEYHAKDLAGKDAKFVCTIHEVKEEQLPELNDDFALDVSEFDTLEEYKADIRKELEKRALDAADYAAKNSVMEKVYEANKFDVPKAMIEDEEDSMLAEFEQQMSYQGLKLADYCKYTNQTTLQLKGQFAEEAEKRVATRLILKAIVEKEKIEVSDKDVDEEIALMAKQYGMSDEDVRKNLGDSYIEYLKSQLRMTKAVDFVYEKAKIKDVEPAEESADADEKADASSKAESGSKKTSKKAE